MTFLDIVQKVVRYAGIADSGPSTVSNQTGDYLKAITYVQDAHAEIQNLHFDWDFLWGTGSLNTAPGIDLYPGSAGLGIWDAGRIFLDGERLPVHAWQDYSPEKRDPARPEFALIRPDNQLQLVPAPNKTYTLAYDYFRRPRVLVNNDDQPLIPAQFRDIIVGRALMLFGNYEAASEAKIQGAEIYQAHLERMEQHQLSRRQQTHGRQESAPITVVVE